MGLKSLKLKALINICSNKDCIQSCKFMVEKENVDINGKCTSKLRHGYTPLMIAFEFGCEDIIKYLLSKGAKKIGVPNKSLDQIIKENNHNHLLRYIDS